ncbi:MAG: cytochrome-c oxidase, cbb3-type subunit III [Pseudomonadota bacterium]|nr:cytochrome-c oxidase, cbb3-type subunit III [Pseudomonadota bacterium]
MNSFWSAFIIVLTLANILACWWLIRWTSKREPGETAETSTTGHVWDGDLTEYNNPLPRWWLYMFHLSIVFGLAYLVFYPGLGHFSGLLGWTQVTAYERELAAAEDRYGPLYAQYGATEITALAQNDDAMGTASRLFANNCAVCHGSDARGAPGFPNLTDDAWLYGSDPAAIKTSILNGRSGVMPALGAGLGEDGTRQVANYVMSLSGNAPDPESVAAGRDKYMMFCVACHGPEAKGNPMLGAPNLTDDAWLYGSSLAAIIETINSGRNGIMPAHKDLLGEDRSHLLAAYVYKLSGGATAAGTE